MPRLSIAKQGLVIVILLLAVELVFVGAIAQLLRDINGKLAKERQVVAVLSSISTIANLTQRLEIGLAYSAFNRKLKEMLGDGGQSVEEYRAHIKAEYTRLRELTADDPEALELVTEQEQLLNRTENEYRKLVDENSSLNRREGKNLTRKLLSESSRLSGKFDKLVARYKSIEESTPESVAASVRQLKGLLALGAVLNLLAGLALAYFFIKRVSSRIDRLAANMGRYQNRQDVPEIPGGAGDEINQLEMRFKQMVDSLALAARNEEALVRDAHDVICTMDASGIFTEINDACFSQWGYLKDEVIGRHFDLIVSAEDVANVKKNMDRLREKSGFISFESVVKRVDSTDLEASWSCYWSAESKSIFCFIRDVSELNRMEETLKREEQQVLNMMASIPIGLLVVDEEGRVKSANREIIALTGLDESAIAERPMSNILSLSGNDSAAASLKTIDGEPVPAEVTITALSTVGRLDKLVIVDDVRTRLRFENMKRDFVALLRENLRTPLLKVRDLVETAGNTDSGTSTKSATESDTTDNTSEQARIQRITANADRLLRLINELLEVETLSPGKLVSELKPVSIMEIVEEAVNALSGYATNQGVSVRVDELDQIVVGDRDRLVQVVINLLSNAIKFSTADSEVVLSAKTVADMVEVGITDSGKGIPTELARDIFTPYVQSSFSDSLRGTGLGLPICKAIIDSHNGSIGVESVSGAGSRFWFRVPRSD